MCPELQPTEKAQEVPVMPVAPHTTLVLQEEEMHQAPLQGLLTQLSWHLR